LAQLQAQPEHPEQRRRTAAEKTLVPLAVGRSPEKRKKQIGLPFGNSTLQYRKSGTYVTHDMAAKDR
jgi:hypothetical protein